MDVFFELLTQLADALKNPVTFLLVLALIIMTSFALTHLAIKSAKKGGFWSLLFKIEPPVQNKPPKELIEIRDKLIAFITSMQALQTLKTELYENNEDLKNQIFKNMRKDLENTKNDIIKEIDEIQAWMKMHDVIEQQTNQNMREQLQRIQDVLNEYVRNIVPEFRDDNKEITRSLSELSKDIALIERTIQTRIGAIGVKLKQ